MKCQGKSTRNSLSRLGIGMGVRKGVREDFQNEKIPYVSWRVVYELTRIEERHSRQMEQPVQKHGGKRENRTYRSSDLVWLKVGHEMGEGLDQGRSYSHVMEANFM